VEAIAAEYIQALRTIQPQGPYLLGGECIGGVVAFEMAQQLQAQGQLIDLILLDTHCPTRARVQRYQRRLWKNRIKRLPSDLAKLVSPLAQRQAVEPEGQPLTPLNRLQPAKEYLLSKLNFGDRNRRSYPYVILRYQPQPYPGRLTILTNEIDYQKHPTLGWELWADAITVHPLVGDHESYLGTYAKVNASRLKACLDAAPASEGSSLDDRS
jgi:thioesterase domain-containing protein